LHYQGLSKFKSLSTPICANYLDSSHVECNLIETLDSNEVQIN
jgi:hypothetical protein